MKHRQLLLTIPLIALLTSSVGCSNLKRLVYRIDVNQGNYLDAHEIQQLKLGMTQPQVIFLLGTPALQEPFITGNSWHYLFYRRREHQPATQTDMQLNFDAQGKLQRIISDLPEVPAELKSPAPESKKLGSVVK
ncbi:MAG: outer membrane protein assembly factor BamE [Candidatus Symbiodolus clandestinus]